MDNRINTPIAQAVPLEETVDEAVGWKSPLSEGSFKSDQFQQIVKEELFDNSSINLESLSPEGVGEGLPAKRYPSIQEARMSEFMMYSSMIESGYDGLFESLVNYCRERGRTKTPIKEELYKICLEETIGKAKRWISTIGSYYFDKPAPLRKFQLNVEKISPSWAEELSTYFFDLWKSHKLIGDGAKTDYYGVDRAYSKMSSFCRDLERKYLSSILDLKDSIEKHRVYGRRKSRKGKKYRTRSKQDRCELYEEEFVQEEKEDVLFGRKEDKSPARIVYSTEEGYSQEDSPLDPIQQEVLQIFQEAQDMIFNDPGWDFHSKGLTKNEALYSEGNFTPIPDKGQSKTSLKIFGMDSGGRLGLENMFHELDEPTPSLWDYVGIDRK